MSTFIKIFARMLLILAVSLATVVLLIALILLVNSRGEPEKFRDGNGKILKGSISEKTFLTIGGVRQGMFIRGKSTDNPVLLYIHGGPAFPNYFLIEKYAPGLEDYFTVCYWEQRGGGLSYSPDVTIESMNFRQFASDAIEVANYLRKRFRKQKVYLMAHSGGTPFAIMAAATAPDLFHAYIGMAQITDQQESEKIAFRFMEQRYKTAGNRKALEELNKYPVLDSPAYFIPFYRSLIRDKSMHELGIGTMRNMRSVLSGVFIPVWMCRAYTLKEKINIWKSKFSFLMRTRLIDELFAADIPAMVPELMIPVYFFSGKYDLTVNRDLSRAYLDKLKAPLKGFYTFSESAHSPLFEEPGKCREILTKDVLNGTAALADPD